MKKIFTLFLTLVAVSSFSSDTVFKKKVQEYLLNNCSSEYVYELEEIQQNTSYIHYTFNIVDKGQGGREQSFSEASFSFQLKDTQLIEATCPDKDQSIIGNTHHFEFIEN